MKKMSVDDKLGLNKFYPDEHNPHIEIDPDFTDEKEIMRVVKACPAELYKYENGKVIFNHEGCLECGTCRVVSGGKVLRVWHYPVGSMGIEYRQG